jgi:hypothetical protein
MRKCEYLLFLGVAVPHLCHSSTSRIQIRPSPSNHLHTVCKLLGPKDSNLDACFKKSIGGLLGLIFQMSNIQHLKHARSAKEDALWCALKLYVPYCTVL